ncbi:MAG: hypothetical protein HXX09_08235 [Bacteroidetes bacterium]|nr:hypothetical protein [Bacteroidota bacterium]
MKDFRIFLLFFVFCILISSCKKDEDISYPTIVFSAPGGNQTFNVLSSINIRANISDDSKISIIEVNLVDENLIPVLSSVSISPNTSNYDLNIDYSISNITLKSGTYFVHIYAADEFGNNKHKYLQISLNAIPKKFKFVTLVNYVNSNTIGAIKIDSLNNIVNLFSAVSDYSASESNCNSQQLLVAGKIFGDLNAFGFNTNQYCWTEPVVSSPPFAYFTNMKRIGENIYVSFFEGDIRAFNSSGAQVESVNPIAGMYPMKVIQFGNYLLVDYYFKAAPNYFNLVLFTFSTFSISQQLQTDMQIVDFFEKDNENVYVFGNTAGQAEFKRYNVQNNALSTVINLPVGKMNSVTQISSDDFLIAHETGVFLYSISTNLFTNVIPLTNAKKIKFEELNSEIYIAEPHKLSKYNYPGFGLINSINITDSILDLHLIYNKN